MAQTSTLPVIPFLPPQYDVLDEAGNGNYDPAFTADITYRMNIPHRIGADGQDLYNGFMPGLPLTEISSMNVPDKIIVLGKDESIGVKEEPRLHLDFTADSTSYVNVSTPPRVLTLDETPFPSLDDGPKSLLDVDQYEESRDVASEYRALRDGFRSSVDTTACATPMDSSLMYITAQRGGGVGGGESELILVQRHLTRLSRHIHRIEADNAKRSSREKILYPLVLGYFAWKLIRWILARND